MVLYSNYRKY